MSLLGGVLEPHDVRVRDEHVPPREKHLVRLGLWAWGLGLGLGLRAWGLGLGAWARVSGQAVQQLGGRSTSLIVSALRKPMRWKRKGVPG